jgi:hypothetical protein
MVRGRLRTRQMVVNDPDRGLCQGRSGWMVRHGLWLVVRGLPEPAEAAAGSDSPCTVWTA